MEISLDIPALAARILDLASARKVYSSAGTQYTMGEQAFQKALQSALDDVVLRMQDHHQALQACLQHAPERPEASLHEHVTNLLERVQILQESVDFTAQQAQAPADLLSGSDENAILEDEMDTRYTEPEGLDGLRVTPDQESISTTDTEVVADSDITPAQPDAAESDGAKSEF